ncbi:unnamed protein product [Bathycoccus prasinos]
MFHDEYSYEDICQNEKCFSSEDIEFGALLILSSIGAILVNHKKSRQRCYLQGCRTSQKILITGEAGFIASHVAILFAKKYPHCKVIALDKLDYCANVKHLRELSHLLNFKFIMGDIQWYFENCGILKIGRRHA